MTDIEKYFGRTVVINGPVVCNDGTTFDDYTLEDHIKFLGLSLSSEEKNDNT